MPSSRSIKNNLSAMYLRREEDRAESPRPSKRRNSGPCATAQLPLTPRQTPLTATFAFPVLPNKKMTMPKVPLAPRPSMAAFAPLVLPPHKPEIFVPSMDSMLDMDTAEATPMALPLAAASRLKRRPLAVPSLLPKKLLPKNKKKLSTLEAIASAKPLEEATKKAIPAPAGSLLRHHRSRSCHALCA